MASAIHFQMDEDLTHSMEDSEIIAEFLKSQDPDLFELLVDRHKEKVFRLALSILGPSFAADAEEVTQEAFLLVYQQLGNFRRESRFTTWLYRIAHNRAIDLTRRARYQRPHIAVEELHAVLTSAARSPLAMAVVREKRQAVLDCLDEIPNLYRTVLYLHYWQECEMEEIGEMLGAPVGTIKSYLHRARKRFSAQIRKRGLSYGDELY